MKLVIITHVPHYVQNGQYYAYMPYVKEMNIWIANAKKVTVVAPRRDAPPSVIDMPYKHTAISLKSITEFNLLSARNIIASVFALPRICITIFKAMHSADHIHLRCPGNVGLVGCLVQIFFPRKPKTAKYAGNWDPNAVQPLSYKLQKLILNNTFLTRNMTVIVYGDWPGSSRNIKPFCTATYREADIVPVPARNLAQIKLLFVGTLSPGKQPLLAVQIAEALIRRNFPVTLDFYGEGSEAAGLHNYIQSRQLGELVTMHGNQSEVVVRAAYQNSHVLILPSKSEGWPKVVAEAMFWGCVPMVTPVSCVPEMLGHGNRGIIISGNLVNDIDALAETISNSEKYNTMADNGMLWARRYTLDYFEAEIKNILMKDKSTR